MATINGRTGYFKGISMPLPAGGLTLGRDKSGDGRLSFDNDSEVSRDHCIVQFDERVQRFRVTDLGSSNGTFLMPGDQRLAKHQEIQCEPGQLIRVGPNNVFELTFASPSLAQAIKGAAVAEPAAAPGPSRQPPVENSRGAEAPPAAERPPTFQKSPALERSISKSETTRLLCATALVRGARFAEEFLSHFESKTRGASPELGLDMRLLAQVCMYARDRRLRLNAHLFMCALAALLVALISPNIAVVLFIVSSALVYFRERSGRAALVRSFRKDNFARFDPDKVFNAQLPADVSSALPADEQNLIVYTGFVPFVGAGPSLGGWSFAVDVHKPSNMTGTALEPVAFEADDLYRAIGEDLQNLDLRGLDIRDFFFVSGREIRVDKQILPDIYGRPAQVLSADCAERYAAESDTRIRHYRWIRVHDWNEELVTSYFLRCAIRGRNMHVEINRCVLTPIRDEFREIDRLSRLTGWRIFEQALGSVIAGPLHGIFAPLMILERLSKGIEQWLGFAERRRQREIADNRLFDYGAGQGYRQSYSSGNYWHYFQKADGDFYTKVLEKAVLDRIITFLDDHHIDTSDLRERQTLIMNSGIIVHGGDVNAESLAVGRGAQAIKTARKWMQKGGGA